MASNESLILDSLDLTTGAWRLEALDCPPPAKRPEWAQGADTDGALLVRDPQHENRTVTLKLRVARQADMDTALSYLLTLSKKLEECELHHDGLGLVWTPAESTNSITFYVLSGVIQDLPITQSGEDVGWFQRSPVVTVVLTCKPFGYGDSVAGGNNSSSGQLLSFTLASVPGDVPAEGRLIVTDTASQNRRYVEWGLENRFYNSSLSLQINSFTTTGYIGTSTTRSGSVNSNVVRGTLTTSALGVCSLGSQSHVGTYRVKARCYASSLYIQARLAYSEGGGVLHRNAFQAMPTQNWVELDLGLITINETTLGTQRWTGQIEAFSTISGDTLDIDYVLLIPAGEGYGRVRSPLTFEAPATYSAHDEFNQTTGALTGKTLPTGGSWAGSGDADDFSIIVGNLVSRTAVSDTSYTGRFVTANGATATATMAQVDVKHSTNTDMGGVIARYTNTSNYVRAVLLLGGELSVVKVVAGTPTELAHVYAAPSTVGTFSTIRLLIDSTGRWAVWAWSGVTGQSPPMLANGQDSTLATGGTLASGYAGFYDERTSAGASTRYYDNFLAAVPVVTQSLYSGRALEIRHDGAVHQDSTGTYYSPVPSYRGSRMLIPPAGDQNRTTRVVVKAHRNNIEVADAVNVTDALQASVTYTPRYLVVPG